VRKHIHIMMHQPSGLAPQQFSVFSIIELQAPDCTTALLQGEGDSFPNWESLAVEALALAAVRKTARHAKLD
jgi:hypothetical protein